MNQKTNRAVLRPPTQGTVPGVGITRLATSTTAVAHDLGVDTAKFFGKKIRIYNEDATIAIWVALGAAATPVIDMTTAGGSTIVLGTAAAQPVKLLAGQSIEIEPSKATSRYLHVQSASGTPILCLYPMSTGVGGV
jgi:hypothetical protein